ncbi:hypothetical protein OW492_00340 [Psychromonas sp. 14N.309.X.WAT.B.A12]|uniref:hypothetical protein n=1 Tax=Psychromonas sp. 14N.309.X.WAT.B.A12 TaxID=2998322 RepID=UPI0025AF2D23|nr:hypothetical protein [Psychromonas sp. 14N.309.X.WAT.B.A12]MDN2661819.1 hypothetical protein [Psychromonas sp. 14N.309.X.WAT.B.A12]
MSNTGHLPFKPKNVNGRFHLTAPQTLCIYSDEIVETLNYLTIIGDFTINKNQPLHLDFSELENLTAAASVMLFAEITRAQLATNKHDIITLSLPVNKIQRKRFTSSGLFKAIKPGGESKLKGLIKSKNTYQSGTDPNKFSLIVLEQIKTSGINLTAPQKKIFSRGVQEAMLNVIHHAYDDNHIDPLTGIGRRWWHAISVNKEKNLIAFIIYDKGQGIPKSITSTTSLPLFNHGECIKHVLPKGITRFRDQPERGKGTHDILQINEIEDNSMIVIYSDHGRYIEDKKTGDSLCHHMKCSVHGTLIEWQLPL